MFLTASLISLMLTKAYKLVRPPVDEPITAFLTDPPKFFLALVRRVGQLCPIKFLTLRTHSKRLIFMCIYNRKATSITNCGCVYVCSQVIQHAMRMRHIVICDLPRSEIFFYLTL
jgi:hypothetical protein